MSSLFPPMNPLQPAPRSHPRPSPPHCLRLHSQGTIPGRVMLWLSTPCRSKAAPSAGLADTEGPF